MSDTDHPVEPSRPADYARLSLARLRIEDGIPLTTMFERVTETAADVLDVARVGVWLLIDDRQALRCVDLFERTNHTHAAGVTLQTREFPDYIAALERRRTIPAEVATTDPRTRGLTEAYLAPLGITSLLDAPIYVAGAVIGVICHEHIGAPREWTTEQRDFASAMADQLALKIRAAEAEELRTAIRVRDMQLAEAQQVHEIAEMAAGIAHDFNTILTIMIGMASLIAVEPDCPPPIGDMAQQILTTGRRGATLAQRLIDFAHPDPYRSRVVRPADIVSSYVTLLQAAVGHRHTIQVDLRSVEGRVLIDPDQLERALLNLVVNARDAMPVGGTITVLVDTVAEQDAQHQPRQFVVVAVTDHGTGIAPDVVERIFEPFFTTKPRGYGTGIGLAVVQQIVSYVGGFIRVESASGQGTSFRLYLPLVSHA